jgi:hypothetical protein
VGDWITISRMPETCARQNPVVYQVTMVHDAEECSVQEDYRTREGAATLRRLNLYHYDSFRYLLVENGNI